MHLAVKGPFAEEEAIMKRAFKSSVKSAFTIAILHYISVILN
jgi:hypothetical protein